ncbi:hypothetical protein D3C71_1496220 [compost metagenome]
MHTLAVNAGNACSGSPNASSDSGCTWYSRLGWGRSGRLRVNAPSCDGAMLMGPLRLKAYSMPMRALPSRLDASTLSVGAPCTLNTVRICRWSCRLAPTPGRSLTTGMPCFCSSAAGPMPDSCSSCGELMAPAQTSTSPVACTVSRPSPVATSTPVQRWLPSAWVSMISRVAWAMVHISKFARP